MPTGKYCISYVPPIHLGCSLWGTAGTLQFDIGCQKSARHVQHISQGLYNSTLFLCPIIIGIIGQIDMTILLLYHYIVQIKCCVFFLCARFFASLARSFWEKSWLKPYNLFWMALANLLEIGRLIMGPFCERMQSVTRCSLWVIILFYWIPVPAWAYQSDVVPRPSPSSLQYCVPLVVAGEIPDDSDAPGMTSSSPNPLSAVNWEYKNI